ncbi:hypothetical protein [Bacteriophage sp.]|nr:hypothetical protein [Bacteriophage sp.]
MNFPEEIEKEAVKNFNLAVSLRQLKEEQAEITDELTLQVAMDSQLSNETKRKAALKILLTDNASYQQYLEMIRVSERELHLSTIRLERLRNDFSITKLEARKQIAASEQVA